MRKKIIAANWKMNLTYAEAMSLVDALVDSEVDYGNTRIILGAPFIYLHDIISRVQSQPNFSIAAQNCSGEDNGAFTGEISVAMLESIGVENIIIGHSERRSRYHEDDAIISKKIKKTLDQGLVPVFCCGEDLTQRKSNIQFSTVENQLNKGLFNVNDSHINECIIAYEPVWAIGTGVNANALEIQEMHSFIRGKLKEKYGEYVSDQMSILYGGSVSPKNAEEIFSCNDVDGGLVGGASLKATDFLAILNSMNSILKVNR